ncbi:unnamed protein product [Camellia sinensis]
MLDTIGANQTIRDGETLVSAGGSFELGFFSPGSGRSRKRYLGIWYKDTATGTVVWVANRDFPLNDTSGLLKLTDQGILVLLNSTEGVVWSSNSSRFTNSPLAQLLESGNLVVNDGNGNNMESFLWQSFDYPSDTLLEGMKFGMNMMTGLDWYLSSWKSSDDPAVEIYYRCEQINSSVVTGLASVESEWGHPATTCLQGFEPKYLREWDVADWSNGCVRRTQLGCGVSNGFLQYSNVKLPDMRYCWFNESMTLDECRIGCLKNCSCTAYANMDIRGGGSGCFLWFGDLIDIRTYSTNGQDVYVKVAASELGRIGAKKLRRRTIAISLALLAGVFLTGLSLTIYLWKKKQKQQQHQISEGKSNESLELKMPAKPMKAKSKDLELRQFDFATITYATDNFSINNKLGEGGFGLVFKRTISWIVVDGLCLWYLLTTIRNGNCLQGVLEDGQEIAIKTFSKNSKHGVDESKNEVIYIARLQHRNLVKLLGYCFQGEEKMLIFEYMPNKSLDLFIFDSMARHFGGNESEANTSRVIGTYGYMSQEYTIDGIFSVKSDVYSFGVLVLEIVSGKRNRGFSHPEHHLNLLGHVSFEQPISICVENLKLLLKTVSISQVWKLCIEGRSRELVDPSVEELENLSELVRAIHVGLLCVQQYPEDRPNMSTVVLMLGSEGGLPQPKHVLPEKGSSTSTREPGSDNIVSATVTLLEGR